MISLEKAEQIAKAEIGRKINGSRRLAQYRFEPVELYADLKKVWHFVAVSEAMANDDFVPCGVSALVDKQNGEIWSLNDYENYLLSSQKQKAA